MSQTKDKAASESTVAFDFSHVDEINEDPDNRIFTKERVEKALEGMIEFGTAGGAYFDDIRGGEIYFKILNFEEEITPIMQFNGRFAMADNNPEREDDYRYFPIYPSNMTADYTRVQCSIEDLEDDILYWDEVWNKSKTRRDLEAIFKEHAPIMRKVNKIVCLGIGQIGEANKPPYSRRPGERNYFQYKAVCTIAEVLAAGQWGEQITKPINIYAEDPAYTETDIQILKRLKPRIQVVEHCETLLKIDRNTFVVGIGLPRGAVPLEEFAIDYVKDFGPAGFFTDTFFENRERRDMEKEMTGKLYKPGDEYPYWTGWATTRMSKYRSQCAIIKIVDPTWFGARRLPEATTGDGEGPLQTKYIYHGPELALRLDGDV